MLKWLWARIQLYPVRAQYVVVSGINMAVAFGLKWNGQQVAMVGVFTAGVLAFITEKVVTPNPTVNSMITTAHDTPADKALPEGTRP